MTDDDLMAVIRAAIDRVSAMAPGERGLALENLQRSAKRIALGLGFTKPDAERFADELVVVLRSSVSIAAPRAAERVLH